MIWRELIIVQSFFIETTDPFEEADTEGEDIDVANVTSCYNLDLDKDN
jgi:hypothetical protein